MLIPSLVIGLVAGLLARGNLLNLATVRLRLVQLLFVGLLLRYVTQFSIEIEVPAFDQYRLPLFAGSFLLLLIGLWVNREQPGFPLAFVGVLLNSVAIVTNGGYMPVWQPSIVAAGLPITEMGTAFHKIVGVAAGGGIPSDFLTQAGPLGDIIPIPIPFIRNVASIGDIFLGAGLAFFLFAVLVRNPVEYEEAAVAALRRRLGTLGRDPSGGAIRPIAIAPAPEGALVSQVALERPQLLGGTSRGSEGQVRRPRLPTFQVPPALERVRRHPYVRLALDGSFSALWTGQTISALGDRIHQVALAFMVFEATDSAVAVGLIFVVATLPNLVFGPIAGTLVDRWDHREVMIVSDLLRAGLVLLIPIAAVTNLALAYPLVFLVTTVSIFFRPAKGAILPRIVAADDLVPANSALWIGETFADIGGYAIAGLFVALLGEQRPLAFWIDSVTYVASAMLIASIAVAPVGRTVSEKARGVYAGLRDELRDGWRFLRNDAILLANTLQSTVGQFMFGIFLVLTPVYVSQSLSLGHFQREEAYGFLEGAIGAGNLIGGFVIGLIGSRLALGRMVIVGFVLTGVLVALFPLTGNLAAALGLAFGAGVGNLAFVIPSQTLFQRRTPPELMGRVLSLRFSVVAGSMTLAMGIGGVLGEWFGAAPVIGLFGLVTLAAGVAGLFVPAVRDA
jgi:MFS family permease